MEAENRHERSVVAMKYFLLALAALAAVRPCEAADGELSVCRIGGTDATRLADASVQVARALAWSDSFDRTADESYLNRCISVCTGLTESSRLADGAWQKAAAGVMKAAALSAKNLHRDAFSACTNALSTYAGEPASYSDAALWREVAEHHRIPHLSIKEALNLYAALNLVFVGDMVSLCAYTNSLSAFSLKKVKAASR